MAYTWTTGETITAENLNATGKYLLVETSDDGYYLTLELNAGEVIDYVEAGVPLMIVREESGLVKYMPVINFYLNTTESNYQIEVKTDSYSFYAYSDVSLDDLRSQPVQFNWD